MNTTTTVPDIQQILNTLVTYGKMLDKRSTDVMEGNCVNLEITKQRAHLALSDALSKAPQDEVIRRIVDTSLTIEDNLDTMRKVVSMMLVNHSLMLECLALGSDGGLIDCLSLQGTLLNIVTNSTPSEAFAHIYTEVQSNVQVQ